MRDNEMGLWSAMPAQGYEGARSQNIENNPMQSSRRPPAFEKQLDTSGKSAAFPHHPVILLTPVAPQ
jgi:hypothetical protein